MKSSPENSPMTPILSDRESRNTNHERRKMNRRSVFFLLPILLAAAVPLQVSGCAGAPTEYTANVRLMETFVQIKISSDGTDWPSSMRKAVEVAVKEAAGLADKLSIYNPVSEIVMLNTFRKREVTKELYEVLKLSSEVSRKTGGAFDITVSPVLKAKGFYKNMPEEIASTIPDGAPAGWQSVRLSDDGKTVDLENNAWVDLSGVAKGYIVDAMAKHLLESGIRHFSVNAGGEIRCTDKVTGEPWRIGIQRPGGRGTVTTLALANRSVATSGDYENFIADAGGAGEMSHIIDPSKAAPMEKISAGITVITADCGYADALATAMMVMGKEKAIALADKLGDVDVIFVEETGGVEKLSFSKNAEKYLVASRENRPQGQ